MRLYSGPLSMFGMKAEIAAREKGLDFELIMVPFDMDRLYEPKNPEVARINPKAQVPVLIDKGGVELFDSTQIFEYLEDIAPKPALWPSEPRERAEARQLELLSDEVFFPNVVKLFSRQQNLDDPVAVDAIAQINAFYDRLEERHGARAFLCSRFTYADIAFYLAQLWAARMSAPLGERHYLLRRWRELISARPAVEIVMRPLVPFLKSHGRPIPDFMLRFG